MILVLLGTNPYPFDRLLAAMDHYAQMTNTQVIAQSGNTPVYEHIDCRPFMSHEELVRLIDDAEVIVCQGGYGSLSDCISRGARAVAVPRIIKYGECVDNQRELVEAFAEGGMVIPVYEIDYLPEAIDKARKMSVKQTDTSALPLHISGMIRSIFENGT